MPVIAAIAALLLHSGAIPVVTGQSGGQAASETDVLAIASDRYARMTVPVRIADKGPFNFLIDTGAQNTVLSRALATQLSIVSDARAKLIGVAGTRIVDTVRIEQLDLGRRSFYRLLAPLLEGINIGADGILGLDSLQGQRVLIDFRRNLIAVDDARALGGNKGFEIVVTARRRSGQLIMTDARIDGIAVQVVIDTGAESSIGNMALAKAFAKHAKHGTTTLTSVTGQQMEASVGVGRSLEVSTIAFHNVLIAYIDSPAFTALGLDKRPALLLGMRDMRSLDRIAIDFTTRKILFDVPEGVL